MPARNNRLPAIGVDPPFPFARSEGVMRLGMLAAKLVVVCKQAGDLLFRTAAAPLQTSVPPARRCSRRRRADARSLVDNLAQLGMGEVQLVGARLGDQPPFPAAFFQRRHCLFTAAGHVRNRVDIGSERPMTAAADRTWRAMSVSGQDAPAEIPGHVPAPATSHPVVALAPASRFRYSATINGSPSLSAKSRRQPSVSAPAPSSACSTQRTTAAGDRRSSVMRVAFPGARTARQAGAAGDGWRVAVAPDEHDTQVMNGEAAHKVVQPVQRGIVGVVNIVENQ